MVLQRQILHFNDDIGRPKVESAVETLKAYNPDTNVKIHEEPITSQKKLQLNEVEFRKMLEEDQMADDKLREGIINFSKAIEQLETLLKERLVLIENHVNVA